MGWMWEDRRGRGAWRNQPQWALQGWVEVGEAEPCRVGREVGIWGKENGWCERPPGRTT